ncbi:hypothetical protein QBC37DRAFT_327482 [Rhypophila decipiens]|uniref:PNPLA domain-containing protein n=1 Tax=Rhypophila decipiens TaxID=261697 RepID=A0AAN7B3Z8_9PEZI|nr:hypothetical protein QBC37DRAFT_327482 [Rhypophila decipiens]
MSSSSILERFDPLVEDQNHPQELQSPDFPESRPGLGLNLLCLDGGGVRGLSSLYIVKQLMESINLESPPKPCQIFDMIGGTSTGGLIAIMLGRLEMSVDDCIEAYRAMSPKIFTKVNHRLNLRGKVQGRFDHTAIEESVKNILREHHLPEDEKFYQPSKHGSKRCMTFVCATSKQTGKTVVFSSYPSARRGRSLLDRATIWQVARATSAATSFFDPVEIGDEEFVDGATPANNPIAELWSEAYEVFSNVDAIWSLEDNVACVVSIGTGVPMLRPFGDDPLSIGAKLVKIATDTEKAAEDFARHHPRLVREGRYFRFNVQKGLEAVGLEEQAKHKEIISSTRFYTQTQDVQKLMMGCAEALAKKSSHTALARNYDFAQGEASRPDIRALEQSLRRLRSLFTITPSSDVLGWFTNTSAYQDWISLGGCIYYPLTHATTIGFGRYLIGALPAVWEQDPQALNSSIDKEPPWTIYVRCESIPDAGVSDLVRSLVAQVIDRCFPTEHQWLSFHQQLSPRERQLLSRDLKSITLHTLFDILRLLPLGHGSAVLEHSENSSNMRPFLVIITNVHFLRKGYIEEEMTQLRAQLDRVGLRVLLTGKETLDFNNSSWGASQFRRVDEATEYREFLKSIEFDDMHTRRNQVGVALGGTTEWIKTHPAFEEWSDEADGILWIQGKPGSGKSVLAKSIIEMIQQAGPSNLLTASWFYSKRGGDVGMSHISMMRSICYQLLSQNRQLFQACAGIYRQRGDVMERLPKIMEAILGHVDSPPIICLLDGLDESADRDGKRGRDMLELLVQLVDNPGSKAKIIGLSRPYSSIEEAYGTYDILLEAENGSDIEKIVDSGMSSLVEAMESKKPSSNSSFASRRRQKIMAASCFASRRRQKIMADRRQAYNNSPGPELDEVARKQEMLGIRTYLIDRAQGVTLWVTLCIDQAVRYVSKGPCTWATIRRMLASLPLQVTEMYVLITTELAQECGSEHIRMARKVLAWVIAASAKRPFLVRELFDAVSIPDGWEEPQLENCRQSDRDPIASNRPLCDSWPDFCRSVLDICGPLVEFLNMDSQEGTFQYDRLANVTDGSVVQLVHQTAKDFLETTEAHVFALKPGDSQHILEIDSDLYFQLVIPMQITSYTPVLDDVSPNWRKTVVEMVEYLDDKHLLPFILTHCRLRSEHTDMAAASNKARWMLSTFFYDMSYRDTDVEGVLEQTVVGSCFILACKRGMQTAVDNLLYLSSLRPSWWRIHKRAVISACWGVGKSQRLSAVARLLENHRPPRYTPARRDGGTYNPEKLLWLKHSKNYSPEAEKLLLEGPEAGRVSPDAGDIRIPAGVYNEDEVLFPEVAAGPKPLVQQAIARVVHYLDGHSQPLELTPVDWVGSRAQSRG